MKKLKQYFNFDRPSSFFRYSWWFFIFPVYTLPTVFVFLCTLTQIRPYENSLWILWIWGGFATWAGNQGLKIAKREEIKEIIK